MRACGYATDSVPIRSGARARKRRRRTLSSFSSSSFVALTTITATDDVEASAKVGLEEKAADGTVGADGPFNALATSENPFQTYNDYARLP